MDRAVIGALGFRLIFIFTGAALLEALSWTAYLLGGLLLWTSWKMAFRHDAEIQPVLAFAGLKLILSETPVGKLPIPLTLGVIALLVSIASSLWVTRAGRRVRTEPDRTSVDS